MNHCTSIKINSEIALCLSVIDNMQISRHHLRRRIFLVVLVLFRAVYRFKYLNAINRKLITSIQNVL